jgi:hypothetical protein
MLRPVGTGRLGIKPAIVVVRLPLDVIRRLHRLLIEIHLLLAPGRVVLPMRVPVHHRLRVVVVAG